MLVCRQARACIKVGGPQGRAPALDAEGRGRVPLLEDSVGVDDEEDGERSEAQVGGPRLDAALGKDEQLGQGLPLPV